MYLPDEMDRIGRQFASNPLGFCADKLIGLFLLLASMPALALYIALFTRSGRDWDWLSSLPVMFILAHLSIGMAILGGLGFRVLMFRKISLRLAASGIGCSAVIGMLMLISLVQ